MVKGEEEIERRVGRKKTIERTTARFAFSPLLLLSSSLSFFCLPAREEKKRSASTKSSQHALVRGLLPLSSATCQDQNAAATLGKGGKQASSGGRGGSFRERGSSSFQPRSARDGKKKKSNAQGDDHHPESRESCVRGSCRSDARLPYLTSMRSLHGWPWRLKREKTERNNGFGCCPTKKQKNKALEELEKKIERLEECLCEFCFSFSSFSTSSTSTASPSSFLLSLLLPPFFALRGVLREIETAQKYEILDTKNGENEFLLSLRK